MLPYVSDNVCEYPTVLINLKANSYFFFLLKKRNEMRKKKMSGTTGIERKRDLLSCQ